MANASSSRGRYSPSSMRWRRTYKLIRARSSEILHRMAPAPEALIRSSHVLPLFHEIILQDIVLGIFPFVTTSLAGTLPDAKQVTFNREPRFDGDFLPGRP